ncbi:MAG: NAD(P)H-binding protein [bacterium]|nr:NAD(P)H-binding protein [bacterium]
MSAAPLFVTGANGHLGRDLIRAVGDARPVRAAVRSQRAASTLSELPDSLRPDVHILDYADESALVAAGEGCSTWVHLVGILKEGRAARYEDAHERTCEVLARAAEKAGAARIVYMSILGADPASRNRCLASKARAEAILTSGQTPATTLRVPMVLGPDEIAAGALRGQACAPITFLTRGGASREQPIDARDVVTAIQRAADEDDSSNGGLDLAGPESLSHRELVARVAAILGKSPRIVPLPAALLLGIAGIFELLSAAPPLTRAMLGVLEHDDDIDPGPACRRLGMELTPLSDTLQHTFAATAQKESR